MNRSCNWVDLVQVSSVMFVRCELSYWKACVPNSSLQTSVQFNFCAVNRSLHFPINFSLIEVSKQLSDGSCTVAAAGIKYSVVSCCSGI